MPKASHNQTSFNGGIFSETMNGREELEQYGSGLLKCHNYVPTLPGSVIRRCGSIFMAEAYGSGNGIGTRTQTRLIPFRSSADEGYAIEMSAGAAAGEFRYFKNRQQLEVSPGNPVFDTHAYNDTQIYEVQTAQSVDRIYFAHNDVAMRYLKRNTDTDWDTIGGVPSMFDDGPYLDINITGTTLIASAATGSVTVTASAVTGINENQGFLSTDVGRLIRMQNSAGTDWAWLVITAVGSTTSVTATVKGGSAPVVATSTWRLGAFSDTTGWPAAVTFFDDRLVFGGTPYQPQTVWGSKTGDYHNFEPSSIAAGAVAGDNAFTYTVNSREFNAIKWLKSEEKGLVVGTSGKEWLLRGYSDEPLSPGNIDAKIVSNYGSRSLPPLTLQRGTLHVTKDGRGVRELDFVDSKKGFVAKTKNAHAHTITEAAGGVLTVETQQSPYYVLWCVLKDGTMASMTFDVEYNLMAWATHSIGHGAGTTAKITSACAVTAPDGDSEDLYISVERTIPGVDAADPVKYVEYIPRLWETGDDNKTSNFFDCAAEFYDGSSNSTMDGLDHLEGETVSVKVDGVLQTDKVVSGGSITLDYEGYYLKAGYKYPSYGETLDNMRGSARGSAVGSIVRIHDLYMRLFETLELHTGPSSSKYDVNTFREYDTPLGENPELVTGVREMKFDSQYDRKGHVFWYQDAPYPSTIVGIMTRLESQDT